MMRSGNDVSGLHIAPQHYLTNAIIRREGMARNITVWHAVRTALVMSAVAAASVHSAPVTAQEEPAADELATVVVTGTRILRRDYEAPSPVVTIGNELLQQAGTVQIETVLNQLPQLVPSLTTTSNNPSSFGGAGQALVDLRGLGPTRTLVLLDGTRLMPTYTNGQVDMNQVPAALIENIEVLTGGASAAYGSDAIGGVVNVRLRRDFTGVQLDAQYGVTEEGDGDTLSANLLMGGNFADDRGNMVISLSYDDRERIFAADREFSRVSLGANLRPFGSAIIPEGRYNVALANQPNQAALDAVFAQYGVAPGAVTPSTPIGFNADGTIFATAPVTNFRGDTTDPGFNPNVFSYNFAPPNYLQLPITRRQIAGFGTFGIGEWGGVPTEVYTRISYTTYNSEQQLAATPITGLTVPVDNPNIPADMAAILAARPDAAAPFSFIRRTTEAGPRIATNDYDVMQGLVGLRGGLNFGQQEWNWDVFGSWGRTETTEGQFGNISRSRIQGLLDGEDLAGCTAAEFNPFGRDSISPACAAAIAIRSTNVIDMEQENFVGVLSGSLVDMPAGPLQMAVGAEYRNTRATFRPDEFLASGDVVGFNAQPPQQGRIGVTELFAELAVPLLRGVPGVESLDLELGYRYSDYNITGGVDTYRGSLIWAPLQQLNLRGSYNRAVRAPSIFNLFLPPQENFPGYVDPCNAGSPQRTGPEAAQVAALCQAQGIPAAALGVFSQPNPQVRAFLGGNPNLDPESADTWTLGAVWQPMFDGFGLRTSVDYWRYELSETIGTVSPTSVINRCFNDVGANPGFDPNNEWCQLFTRLPNGEATNVDATSRNLGRYDAEGIDMQVDYTVSVGEQWGRLNANFLVTHLLEWRSQEDNVSPFGNFQGTIRTNVAEAFPRWKGMLNLGWDWRQFGLTWNARYIHSMRVVNDDAIGSPVTVGVAPRVPSYHYHRLNGRWAPTDNFRINLGVDNIFDKSPPIYTDDAQAGVQSNTDPSTYDILGRRYFLIGTFTF
jgi:iron complex outermembrane recepter protein